MTTFVRISRPIREAIEQLNCLPYSNKTFAVHKHGGYVEPYTITITDDRTSEENVFPIELANFDSAYQGYSATQVVAFLNGWLTLPLIENVA